MIGLLLTSTYTKSINGISTSGTLLPENILPIYSAIWSTFFLICFITAAIKFIKYKKEKKESKEEQK